MTEKVKLYWVYGISILFILLNIVLIMKEFYWSLLLPVVVVILLLYIFSLDKVLLLITFLTPLAINFRNFDADLGISLPTEPLMFGVLVIFLLKVLSGFPYDRNIIRHPLTIAILINLAWILITTLTSEIPLVSIKFFVARLWFVIPFFFAGVVLFKKFNNIKIFSWLYLAALIIVIIYTIINHAQYGFDEETGHWVMTPFFNDHTAYGSALAMFIPVVVGFLFNAEISRRLKVISFLIFAFLILAIILSYSRAAWISLIGAFIVFLLIVFRIKFTWILGVFVVLIVSFYSLQNQILETLERNEQDSSTDFVEHVQSIYNISSDASNLERINRWQAGIRMFLEKPFLGWGPGTYQFLYAPFQRSKEKTIISTNAGDLGNAHSEYIGPMAEQGLPGMLSVVLIIIITAYTAIKVFQQSPDREVRLISLVTLLSLITYFIHGLLNNFLDTDKASVPVWGFMAVIVALDLYHKQQKQNSY